MAYQQMPPSPPPQTIPNYLVQAILVTIFCCLPLGVVAIVYASQVNSALAAGNYQAAMEASGKARTWSMVGLIVGLAVVLIWIVVSVFSAAPFIFDMFDMF